MKKYVQRPWTSEDGIKENEIDQSESKLGLKLPSVMRDIYACIGNSKELLSSHNRFFSPEKLEIENGYLIFMEENQSVVSWGIKLSEIANQNPIVWQRNNTENVWYSEEKTLTELLSSMFEWYSENGLFV